MDTLTPGFFGKLPARGDFVERRLSRTFVQAWDGWLQSAIAASQAELGNDWLDTYLTSPLWSFAASPGVFGERACLGVYMPSVDKVGRYFPMTIAVEMDSGLPPYALLCAADAWIVRAEQLLLRLLDEAGLPLEAFDEETEALTLQLPDFPAAEPIVTTPQPTHFAIGEASALPQLGCGLFGSQLQSNLGEHSLWCSAGSAEIQPSLLSVAGQPPAGAFTALLDGAWQARGWSQHSVEALAAAVPRHTQPIDQAGANGAPALVEILEEDRIDAALNPSDLRQSADSASQDQPDWVFATSSGALAGVAAGFTHKGNERKANQDAFAMRDDAGVWLVADGVGGHGAGELASELAIQALGVLPVHGTLPERVFALEGALSMTQSALLAIGARYGDAERSATTVVAVLLDGVQAAVVWAGDSRVYRLRGGELTTLTTDHSAGDQGATNVITRAVGGEEPLVLDVCYEGVQEGDRLLLCSDGLYRDLTESHLCKLLGSGSPDEACDQMRDVVLAGPANDNLTAVVIDVRAVSSLPPAADLP
ncbi:MAG: type VI secretion system-associated protein TagF [Pseudomonadota bacterium]